MSLDAVLDKGVVLHKATAVTHEGEDRGSVCVITFPVTCVINFPVTCVINFPRDVCIITHARTRVKNMEAGSHVLLHSLKTRMELNHKSASILEFNSATERFTVQLHDASKSLLHVKGSNLEFCRPSEACKIKVFHRKENAAVSARIGNQMQNAR